MSRNIEQIYTINPITTNASTDLMYFGQSPYGLTDDAAMTFANFSAQFGSPFTPAALTETNDTNVTLTLGGTPATALLHAVSITAGWSGTLSLARGGLAAALTASNGGIFYSTASAGAILAGTATAQQMLQSGASTTPAWSTTTWPATTTINQILYSSSANVVAGLTTLNNGVLITSATGVPELLANSGTAGYVLTANTGAPPSWQAGSSITPAALSSSNDTNVTLTLGGTPTTALLQATSITAGWSGTLALARGGLGAAITASNGGIFYSNASTGALLAGTATAGQLLTSGASTTPAWTTSTYPATNAVSTLLYASSANVMAALATSNNGVLITSAGGVPSIGTTLPTGVQTNITELGTVTTGTWSATNIALNKGGTNAALTASNGGIFYSSASAGAILSGTATAKQMLQSGASTTPAWSTTTWPATTTINQILYSSSASVISGITVVNSAVLSTSSGGVPSLSTTLPSSLTIPSPSLTVTPTAPTATAGTNTTQIATTAFVTTAVGGVSAPNLSVAGAQILWLDNADIEISQFTGYLFAAFNLDASPYFVNQFFAGSGYSINTATAGFGGLDTGSIAANTWYQIQIIADSTGVHATGAMLTKYGNSITYPSNYNRSRIVGYCLTDASSHIIPFTVATGLYSNRRVHRWTTAIALVSGSTTTGSTTITVSSAMLPSATAADVYRAFLTYSWTPSLTSNTLVLDELGSGPAPQFKTSGIVATVAQAGQAQIEMVGANNLIYNQSGGTLSINCYGFEFDF